MRRLALLAAVGVALVAAVGSRSQAAGTDLWLIYDGPGAGSIVATPAGGREVRTQGPNARPQNEPLSANGAIADGSDANPQHNPNCKGLHYHGNLMRGADPAVTGCGWGQVVKASETSAELGLIASSFTDEVLANQLLQFAPPDYDRIVRLLERSIRALDDLEELEDTKRDGDGGDYVDVLGERVRDDLDNVRKLQAQAPDANLRATLEGMVANIRKKQEIMRFLAVDHGMVDRKNSSCTHTGTTGADVIRGTRRRDVICAGDGDDRVSGGRGSDLILTGEGNDVADGGPGNDRISTGGGNDRANGGAGNDTIRTGPGTDRAAGGAGRDTVDGRRRP